MEATPLNCPRCGHGLSDRGAFCPSCVAQVRCKSCRELLEQSAVACVECGTPVGEGQSARPNYPDQIAQAPNVMRLEETRTSRKFEARFTDAVVESLSVPLGAYFGLGIYDKPSKRTRSERVVGTEPIEQLPLLPFREAEFVEHPPAAPTSAHTNSDEPLDGTARLHRVFSFEDDKVRLKDSRIKANTKIEFVERLTCMFLYAHELAGREKVHRSALNAMLTEATVNDGNARRWIATTADLLRDGHLVWLSVPGKERAIETLMRIEDPNITGSFVLGSKTRSRSAKGDATTASDDAGATKTGKSRTALESKKIAPWVEHWKATGIRVDAYEVLEGKSSAEKGLFGLWAIRKARGDDGKVVTRVQLAQFLYQAFEIKVYDATLAKALKARDMKEKVINIEGTRFQITPVGVAYVEQMLGLQSKPTLTAASVNGSSPKTA